MLTQIDQWKRQEVENALQYIADIRKKVNAWKAEQGYIGMCALADYQKIGKRWKELASHPTPPRALVEELVENHFKMLQTKVEAKIGKILEIAPTGDNGHDYFFRGEKGDTEVRVILAGGWNVQCAHTRWIFIK